MKKVAGVLCPIASLPSQYGIGDFGPTSYQFLSLLKRNDVAIWQILPLNPLGYGHSPYQPYSSHAMDELYISLDILKKDGLLQGNLPIWRKRSNYIAYELIREKKEKYLKRAFKAYEKLDESSHLVRLYNAFIKENSWVRNYAIWITFKKDNNLVMWSEWKDEQRKYADTREYDLKPFEHSIRYEMWLQFILVYQWNLLRKKAKKCGIKIMGDVPFYVGIDSDDVYYNQKNFLIDKRGNPSFIAGVPPDYFSMDGQRWGNPIYDWEYMTQDKYSFWMDRIGYVSKTFDIVRIDHFRAFDTYWKIPASCPTAREGNWIEAPGVDFFNTFLSKYKDVEIVAEDLGDLRPQVLELRDHFNFPGMRVVEFTFDPFVKKEDKKEDKENMIAYTGTHDNQTVKGWYNALSKEERKVARLAFKEKGYDYTCPSHALVEWTMNTICKYAIIPVQDLLCLNDKARMNVPSTVNNINWTWKMKDYKDLRKELRYFKNLIFKTNRK